MGPKWRMWIWFLMIFGGLALAVWLDLRLFRSVFLDWHFHVMSFIWGLILLYAVRRVSRNTGRTLARYGRVGRIPRFETNRLVDQGPYAHMRHPMHLGLLFFPLAFGLMAGSPCFVVCIWPLEVIFMLLMIKWVEEPEARRKFGEAYDEYAAKRPWFCLKPRCLKALWKKVEYDGGKSPLAGGCS
ncbi:MAG: isoprenylcysteine carboxylmethyltransferase family protein [Chlorobi bacterium]|nr:isoprenylcysteine carboxylmethyltransferase family protein [Chlorobiota bacterium]